MSEAATDRRPGRTTRLAVPVALAVLAAVAVVLIVSGRGDETTSPATTTGPAGARAPLAWAGDHPDLASLQAELRRRDPRTLAVTTGSAPAPPPDAPTEADLTRCRGPVSMASPDPLGDLLGGAGARVEGRPVLVVSLAVGDGSSGVGGTRAFVVDAATCRILVAVDHPA